VATEVRSLAQRSSQAAKDIKELIVSSGAQVEEGVRLVNQAGSSLNEIVKSITEVAGVVADIANASMEQSTGIEEVNRALTQMDEVTQQNSALVEENAATASKWRSSACKAGTVRPNPRSRWSSPQKRLCQPNGRNAASPCPRCRSFLDTSRKPRPLPEPDVRPRGG
jgi:hypothetical protein